MKKTLGLAVLCCALVSFVGAQETPKFEVFGGYSFLHFDSEGVSGSSLTNTCSVIETAVTGIPTTCPPGTFKVEPNLHGWEAAGQYNITSLLGIEADVSGHYGTPVTFDSAVLALANSAGVTGVPPNVSAYNFLVGPVITSRPADSYKIFLHALAGVNHVSTNSIGTGTLPSLVASVPPALLPAGFTVPASFSVSDTAFAFAVGGGVDARLTNHLWVRAVQVDYLLTRHDPNSIANSIVHANVVSGITPHQNNVRVSAGFVYTFGSK